MLTVIQFPKRHFVNTVCQALCFPSVVHPDLPPFPYSGIFTSPFYVTSLSYF